MMHTCRLRGRVVVATESWRRGCLDLAVLNPLRPDEPGPCPPHSAHVGIVLVVVMGGVLLISMSCCLPLTVLLCATFAIGL
jgi:hypothetical protein